MERQSHQPDDMGITKLPIYSDMVKSQLVKRTFIFVWESRGSPCSLSICHQKTHTNAVLVMYSLYKCGCLSDPQPTS